MAYTVPVLANQNSKFMRVAVIGHKWPSTLSNYENSVQGQYWATTGSELSPSGDPCHLVVRDGNSSNSPIQDNRQFHHWVFRTKIYLIRHILTVGRITQSTLRITSVQLAYAECNVGACVKNFDLNFE